MKSLGSLKLTQAGGVYSYKLLGEQWTKSYEKTQSIMCLRACVCVNVETDNTRAIHGRVSRETDDAIITRSTMTVDVCVVLKTRAH